MESPEAGSLPPPPETDTQPHINVGPQHQAELPTFRPNRRQALQADEHATLLWSPECLQSHSKISSDERKPAYNKLIMRTKNRFSLSLPGIGSLNNER